MRTKLLFLALAVTLGPAGLTGCSGSNNDSNNTKPSADQGPAQDMRPGHDMRPDADMSSVKPDMPQDMSKEDMGPVECPEKPRCAQGYSFDESCYCRAPIDRKCQSDADCRAQERCELVTNDRGVSANVCMFDASTLKTFSCPGAPGCEAQQPTDPLLAAAVSRTVTPDGFETAKPAGLDEENYMTFSPPARAEVWNDCGYDGLCPGDEGYTAPDEGEGDGELQGAFIAGFSHGRPAQYCPPELIGCAGPECCASKLAHDDLKAQIAVMRKGDVTVAFVALDAVGFFKTEMDLIREDLGQDAGVDLVVMASTHSHEGPDTVGQWGPGQVAPMRPGVDPRFLNKIRRQTVEGIREAVSKLEPADVYVTVLDVGVDGLAISDSRPPYVFDDNVPVVRLVAKDDSATIATMLSIGNHAEVLWSKNPYISADYFHFTRKYIEQGLAEVVAQDQQPGKPALAGVGGVTVMFAGAVGGLINPGRGVAKSYAGAEFTDHGFAKADAVGQSLAGRVLSAIHDQTLTKLSDEAALRLATRSYLTPISNVIFQAAAFRLKLFRREIFNATPLGLTSFTPGAPQAMTEVSMVRLGPLTFFTAPGEVFPESLVGGFPGKPTTQNPVVGDIEERRVPATCDAQGLPPLNGESGSLPCIISATHENPPDWSKSPDPPYVYDRVPGQYPFFIGLGQDFLGYFVMPYDFQYNRGQDVPGSHYEETNAASGELYTGWVDGLNMLSTALAD